jgi:uracil-DNA glycosylase
MKILFEAPRKARERAEYTAAQALLGRDFRVTQHRGELMKSSLAPFIMATVHPSSILRAPDQESRHAEMERFIDDLKKMSRFTR